MEGGLSVTKWLPLEIPFAFYTALFDDKTKRARARFAGTLTLRSWGARFGFAAHTRLTF
jgi:hypothetical protein